MKAVKKLLDLVDGINRAIGGMVAMLILVLTALIVFEVVLRYGFSKPTVWGTEVSTLLFATYVLLGGGYALYKGDHVKMDVFYSKLPDKGKAVVDLITVPFVLLYCWILFIEGGSMVTEAFESQRKFSTDWAPLMWPWLVALPAGAVLLAMQAVSNVLRGLTNAFCPDNAGNTHTSDEVTP